MPQPMPQPDVPHFEEEGRLHFIQPGSKMPTQEYATALDYIVFTCVDLAFTCKKQVLLAKRNRQPRQSWWIVGGRMVAGESPLNAARRKAAEEARLKDLSLERFRYIGAYSTCFALRHQEPVENGSHSVNLTYQIDLSEIEKAHLVLSQEEYESEWKWVEFNQVQQLLGSHQVLDQCLLHIVQSLE